MMVEAVTLIVNQATLIRLMMVQTRAAEDVRLVKRPECSSVQSRAVRKPLSGSEFGAHMRSLERITLQDRAKTSYAKNFHEGQTTKQQTHAKWVGH